MGFRRKIHPEPGRCRRIDGEQPAAATTPSPPLHNRNPQPSSSSSTPISYLAVATALGIIQIITPLLSTLLDLVDKVGRIAYTIEDVVDDFTLHSLPYTFHHHRISRKIHSYAHQLHHHFPLPKISKKIASITESPSSASPHHRVLSSAAPPPPRRLLLCGAPDLKIHVALDLKFHHCRHVRRRLRWIG